MFFNPSTIGFEKGIKIDYFPVNSGHSNIHNIYNYKMKCQIISIGNELLLGDTVNTNASWLGRFLAQHGVEVTQTYTISDDLGLIKHTIRQGMDQADLIITTGGLGPTHDDLTKQAVQEIFGAGLVVHQPTLDFIKSVFKKRNIPLTESNYQQAEVPDNCEVLFNKQGTAPGMWFEEDNRYLAVLPGVPFEMQHLMQHQVLPKIKAAPGDREQFVSRYIVTAGIGESTLSDQIIGKLDNFLSEKISVAYLPGLQGVRIRITGRGNSQAEAIDYIEPVRSHIYQRAGTYIIGEGEAFTLSEAVGRALQKQKASIATAESCTGGMLADQLTNIPGSSNYMRGGVIAYANSVKTGLLGVREEDLSAYGAVSKAVALQMAEGVARQLGADVGVSTTGIAGPGGGTAEKPVGTVWIGYWSHNHHFALKTLFTNDRIINKERSVAVALETVRRTILGIETMPYGLKPQTA